jgi:hypothetical protein
VGAWLTGSNSVDCMGCLSVLVSVKSLGCRRWSFEMSDSVSLGIGNIFHIRSSYGFHGMEIEHDNFLL